MISGTLDRRWRRLAWCALAAFILEITILAIVFRVAPLLWGEKRGIQERVSSTTRVTIVKLPPATPQPVVAPQPVVQRVVPPPPPRAAAPPVMHELSHEEPSAPPQATAPPRPTTVESRLAADQRSFANTLSKLKADNAANAIPTIDPSTASSASKSYSFQAPAGHNANEGYGIIRATRNWRENGLDCYYGRYSYRYPDGTEEGAEIAWPFCYEPGDDPIREGRREIPMPLPLPGFRLPPGTDLPPLEKQAYEYWLSQQ